MLAQPIFAQRVCMGVDKYAFEVEGCSPVYWEELNIYIWQLSNWGHLRQFGICCLGICWLSQFLLKGCAWEWTMIFGNSQIEVICVNLESASPKYAGSANFCSKGVHGSGQICIWGWRLFSGVFLNTYIWQLSNWGHLRQFGFCFLGICWLSQFLLKGCAWEWTNMHLRLKVVLHCIAGEEYILKIYVWQLIKLRSFASIWNLFFRNMLAQPIFAQRVCMGVDKYAF